MLKLLGVSVGRGESKKVKVAGCDFRVKGLEDVLWSAPVWSSPYFTDFFLMQQLREDQHDSTIMNSWKDVTRGQWQAEDRSS